ncbi:hypothetical protein BJX70DRAFT_357781, partial [Aspergillus crustosus]
MPYAGHCICGRIRVSLPKQPPSSLKCHCRNCMRSGGGQYIRPLAITLSLSSLLPLGRF